MAKELAIAAHGAGSVNMTVFLEKLGGLKVERQVTRDVLRQVDGEAFAVEFEAPFVIGIPIKGAKMDPAHTANVINLETGECVVLIGNEVLRNELDKVYPDNGFVGKLFAIVRYQGSPKDGQDRRYKNYRILELKRIPGGQVQSAGEAVIVGEKKKVAA